MSYLRNIKLYENKKSNKKEISVESQLEWHQKNNNNLKWLHIYTIFKYVTAC